jgi:serine/threonine protein kinase/tetratricopeptide (TPR) repeat protein
MASKAKTPNLRKGDVVAGRFRIVETIGSGGFSVVYRAHQEGMNRFVALKVLKPTASDDEKIVERFRREALYASHLSHPNTITLFDYGHTDDGLCYIAMEHLQGTDLAAVVQRGEPMDLKRVWNILVQCCRSLSEAHRLGLVHRDLKPENIFLVQRENTEFVKVLDFGVSKAISDFADAGPRTMAPLTQEGTVFGTPLYMAPEQAMAEDISPAVDVYALGHIAYEMISGMAAYADCTNAMDVMLRQINDPPLTLPEPWDDSPFSMLIEKCTQKDPKHRIKDASLLLEALMHDSFYPYMDVAERPQRNTRSLPRIPTVSGSGSSDYTLPPESAEEIEEVYRWELDLLEDVYEEVKREREMRLVVIRGTPGTGRSNLLRAFLRHYRDDDGTVIAHRQTSGAQNPRDAGLEADLSCVTKGALRGSGMTELNRVLRKYYDQHEFDRPEEGNINSDSAPISNLSAHRDTFLARITVPFREAAENHDVLIWGVENLERIDTMTLAFLDRFFRDLQAHPAPIMIIATVYPDDLMKRPGLLRYTQGLLQSSKPTARQLHLVPPGERKGDEPEEWQPPENVPADGPADGSYMGGPVPVGEEDEESGKNGPSTEPMEFFESLDEETDSQADAERSEADIAFDTVLGHLAQLGNEVPEELWTLAKARVLPTEFTGLADFIIEQAERFGIIHRYDETITFAKPGFADHLRDSLGEEVDLVQTHDGLANLMMDYFDNPSREQTHTIVRHLRSARKPWRAMELLEEAGERAYNDFDLDSAREYYLLLQNLLEGVEEGKYPSTEAPVASANIDQERVWVRLGEIHGALGEHGAAEDALSKAISTEESSPEVRGRAFKIMGDLAVSQERYAGAKTSYRRARDSFREAGHAGAFVAAMGAMGHCALMEGKPEEAEDILGVALDKAERLNNDMLVARLGRFMGQVLTRRGRFLEAIEHLENSMELFERLGHDKEVVECLVELGHASYAGLQFEESREYFTRAISLSSSMHVSLPESPHLGLARALAALANLDQAEAHLAEALANTGTSNDRLQMAHVHYYMGDLYLAQDDYGEAMSHYERVEEIARYVGHTQLWLDSLIRRAYLSFDAGDSSESYDQLSQTMQLAEEVGDEDQELCVRAHIIYLQLLEHDFRAQGDTFGSLLKKSQDMGLTRAPVLCHFFKADVMAARGDIKYARQLLRDAREAAAQIGDYALFIPIARRDYLLQKRLGELGDPHTGSGFGIGAVIAPETDRRRFNEGRIGG